ncbi:signal recognition particle-docking protein FtsY [Pleurocapsa sp. CCALA 161]|uniref:signal recognition particle-docking protein FtsY n=1 Tax=Pleurocapsa sp. CCALA 161 TaxID=2107688 RepID=UPI000D06060F|nr:signal recognition particle-docking protein FtsY [Pleurocapsa sp. CCALA 161]PSB12508.1 signal recognition particle-docking protein FtsY [Pleurocapsa sp. CCALA 161]
MFNWFRRNEQAQQPPETKPAETQPEVTTDAKESSADVAEPDYLAFAKAAYKNIQERKGEAQQTVEQAKEPRTEDIEEESESANEVEIVEPDINEPDVAESVPESTEALEEEIEGAEEVTAETTAENEIENQTESPTPQAAANVPAWMQKSQGLAKLKETAIETPVEEVPVSETELDEDFIWSSQVLAKSGRTAENISEEEINWLTKLRQGLGKTRIGLVNQLKAIVGKGPLNDDAVMSIESLLLQADVGIEATDYIIETLQRKLKEEVLPPDQAIAYLKTILQDILDKPLQNRPNSDFVPEKDEFNIWLLTGVNGAGKTTTIGKLANLGQKSGYSCLIAAADTFRAAAVQQVKVWGERTNTPVIANPGQNTDPASVVFDAIAAAQAKDIELLLVDTAGRLQNKQNLMTELAKIRRIIDKKAPNAKVESLLVIDATLGQNGLRQAQVFSEAANLSGVVLTKLDGSARGGVALAITQQLNLPIRFIGAGEGIEDLRPFSSYEFVEALLNG